MANSKTVTKATISEKTSSVLSIENIQESINWHAGNHQYLYQPLSGRVWQPNLFASESNHLNSWTKTAHHLILQLESYPEKHTNSPSFLRSARGNLPHPNPYLWLREPNHPEWFFISAPNLQGDEGFPIFAANTLVHQFTWNSQVFGFYPKSRNWERGVELNKGS